MFTVWAVCLSSEKRCDDVLRQRSTDTSATVQNQVTRKMEVGVCWAEWVGCLRQRHHLKKRLFPNGSVQTPFFRLVFNARSRAKLKSHSRFLEVGGINLHSVSLCRASFIHDAMIREARCPAFSIIIGRDAVLCGLMIQCARA